MAEQGEACSSVYLACDSFGLGVDAFGGAVGVRERERGVHGVAVAVQAPGEGVQVRQVDRADLDDPEPRRRRAKSSTPITLGVQPVGNGMRSRTRRAVWRDRPTASTASRRAPARPANSFTTACTCVDRRAVRLW